MKSKRLSVMSKKTVSQILMLIIFAGITLAFVSSQKVESAEKFRILHIMSYHSPWVWTDEQLKGFKDALKDLNIEYKVFQMDTKRISTNEWKEKIGKEARELIDSWKPDLVYTNDDNAQEYVARHYVNKDIPFVFSGVNKTPDYYGFVGSKNIAGVLEQEHFVETVQLLKKIIPGVSKIAVLSDEDITWEGVMQRMKEKAPRQLPDVEFVSWDIIRTFDNYKQKINGYRKTVDAIALLGVFNFRDENGKNVPYQEVLKWTAENSSVPDFSFWNDRTDFGTLCAVTVSGYNQGYDAGKIARGILAQGKSPSSYPFEPTVKGEPIINLARAKKLGIKIDSEVLLSSKVLDKFAWEK